MTSSLTDLLPDIIRLDAAIVTFSQWTVGTPDRQRPPRPRPVAGS